MELALQALSNRGDDDIKVLVVLGPFMDEEKRTHFKRRAESMPATTVLDYHPRIESLIENAAGLITMGGYNTFCEILSFNQPAIVIPRTTPRTEQLIRARRATELGLVNMLEPTKTTAADLQKLLATLTNQPGPQANLPTGMLDGMDVVCDRVVGMLGVGEDESAA